MALRSLVPIQNGEEILVNYKYTSNLPSWYEELQEAFLRNRDGDEKEKQQ